MAWHRLILQCLFNIKRPRKVFVLQSSVIKFGFCNISTNNKSFHCMNDFPSFNDMILFRRNEASRSGLIKLKSETNVGKVVKVCENFGAVKKRIVYINPLYNEIICLVEFENVDQAINMFNNRSTQEIMKISNYIKEGNLSLLELQSKKLVETRIHPNFDSISRDLEKGSSLIEQMQVLYEQDSLSDIGVRLRFIACNQIENMLEAEFPNCHVLPFGSSVNGFGRYDCDLDALLDVNHINIKLGNDQFSVSPTNLVKNRRNQQETLRKVYSLLKKHSHMSKVFHILRAKVPIIKSHHSLTSLDCDISVYDSRSFDMSKLLYLFGKYDPRVQPLVFTVRRWAKAQGVTKPFSGQHFTNFLITLMTIFFLQCRNPPILPTLQELQNLHVTESGEKTTWKHRKSLNKEDIGELLVNFFIFYEKLPIDSCAISVAKGCTYPKPDYSSIFIQNPLNLKVNASGIVLGKEVSHLKNSSRNSLKIIEEFGQHPSILLKLLERNSSVQIVKDTIFKKDRKFARIFEGLRKELNVKS